MKRGFRAIVLTSIAALCAFGLTSCLTVSAVDDLMSGGQEAINRSVQEAASKGADYDEVAVTERDYLNDVSKAKTATVMVYMCGADLESQDGSATEDLNEMLHATLGDDINVIVETGGTSYWQNTVMDASTDQIWKLHNNGIEHLEDVGLKDMTQPSTLAEFLSYCKQNYSSDRNILVLWDHGGGSVGGYGYDENFPNSPAMAVDDIGKTVKDSGITFDFVGFDACLMASVEDAMVLEPSADYLIASEIPEPGRGWYYTNWLTTLSNNPSTPTTTIGKQIVDDFISKSHDASYPEAQTLSVIDLTKLPKVLTALDTFSTSASGTLASGDFSTLSKAREDCNGRSAKDDYGMVDIETLAGKLSSNDGSAELIDAVDACVVYNKTLNAGKDQHGLSIAFPYTDLSEYPELTNLYSSIGFSKSYAGFLSGFETVRSGGQSTGTLDGTSTDLSSSAWFQDWLSDQYSSDGSYDTSSTLSTGELPITEKGDGYVLKLTDEQWDQIADIQLSVIYGREGGYLDLGSDELYEFDSDGDLMIDWDGTWVALNGQIVEFFADSYTDNDDGTWVSTGYVPAKINGKDAEIVLQWDNQHADGYVTGYRSSYNSGVAAKGVTAFKNGDAIQYTYSYYDTDDFSGKYAGTIEWPDTVTYDGNLAVSYEELGSDQAIVHYVLTDIYGNQYPTESLIYE